MPNVSCEIVREFNVRIPMRDGPTLSADIYRPAGSEQVPIVLTRTPYTKVAEQPPSVGTFEEQGQWWVQNGYAFVVQDVRGRGDSDGVFHYLVNEAADGFDTLAWLGTQPWSSGRVGMVGGSYLGSTQVYAATQLSPYLKAIIPAVTAPDPERNFPLRWGVPFLAGVYWAASTNGHVIPDLSWCGNPQDMYHSLPIVTLDARFGRNLPDWRNWVTHPPGHAYWQALNYQKKLLAARVPMLHITGWYDSMTPGPIENFSNMSQEASDPHTRAQQRLLIGPWGHSINEGNELGGVDFGSNATLDLRNLQLRWFDRWLKELDNGVDTEPRVRLFAMGANRWIEEDQWPPARTRYMKYFLHSGGRANSCEGDGRLTLAEPTNEPPDRFRYDPLDPVPLYFGSADLLGPRDYRDVEKRVDVLVYTSEVISEPTLVCGPMRVRLCAASSARDTDWTVKVLDVWPDGAARLLSHGIIRARFRRLDQEELINPGEVYEYDIDAGATCIELQPGHRIRLEISSSAFPWFDRNLNTGDALGLGTHAVVAEQTVLHDRERPSYLLLPIVPKRC